MSWRTSFSLHKGIVVLCKLTLINVVLLLEVIAPPMSTAKAQQGGMSGLGSNREKPELSWYAREYKRIRFNCDLASGVKCVTFSPDGTKVFVVPAGPWSFPPASYPDEMCYAIDIDSLKIAAMHAGSDRAIKRIAVSRDGNRLAAATFFQTTSRWGDDGKDAVAFFSTPDNRRLSSFEIKGAFLGSLSFSPCGKWIRYALPTAVYVRHIASGQLSLRIPTRGEPGSVAFCPKGHHAAISRGEKTRVVELSSGRTLFELDHRSLINYSLEYSSDGSLLAGVFCVNGKASQRVLKVWRSRRDVTEIKQSRWAGRCHFLPQSHVLAIDEPNGWTVFWDIERSKEVYRFQRGTWREFAFSPDGRYLASGDDADTLIIWELLQQ